LAIWAYFASIFTDESQGAAIWFFAITFLSLPVIGLYYSLRCRNFIAAYLSTLAVGLLAPVVVPSLLQLIWDRDIMSNFVPWELRLSGRVSLVQLVIAAFCWFELRDRLRKRRFPLERAV